MAPFERAYQLAPWNAFVVVARRRALAVRRERGAEQLIKETGDSPLPLWDPVVYHLLTLDLDAAADWYERMIEQRDRVDGGQDDSARRAAREVEARRFNGCRGQREVMPSTCRSRKRSRRSSRRRHKVWPWRHDRSRNESAVCSVPLQGGAQRLSEVWIHISDSLRQPGRDKPLTKPNLTDSCRQAAVTSQLRIPSLTPSHEISPVFSITCSAW